MKNEIERLRLKMRHRSARTVALAAGVNPHTLRALVSGRSSPKYETVKKVLDYLNKLENEE